MSVQPARRFSISVQARGHTATPRAKFPVKVTVVAWQYGRVLEPKLKTAEPVEQTFSIVK